VYCIYCLFFCRYFISKRVKTRLLLVIYQSQLVIWICQVNLVCQCCHSCWSADSQTETVRWCLLREKCGFTDKLQQCLSCWHQKSSAKSFWQLWENWTTTHCQLHQRKWRYWSQVWWQLATGWSSDACTDCQRHSAITSHWAEQCLITELATVGCITWPQRENIIKEVLQSGMRLGLLWMALDDSDN